MTRTPLRRKTPLRRTSTLARRKPLKKAIKGQQRRMREYYAIRMEFLRDHPACAICLLLDRTPAPATEVHHVRGRIGRLLVDTRFFAPSCRGCRNVPHDSPKWAREVGLLAPAGEWNVYPKET